MPDSVPFPHPWSEDIIDSKADVVVGGTPSTAVARYWNGDVPWMSSGDVHLRRVSDVPGRITDTGLRSSAAKMVEPPAVAIALAGQGKTRGTSALTEIALCTNQSVALIKPRDEDLNALYLYYALDYRYEELRARSAGGGRAGLTKQIIQNVPVPFPHPKEQSRIAEILDTLDAAIRETEAVVAKLRQVKAGLLRDLLTRGLDEHGQLRDPVRHPEQFQDSPIGRIPKAWQCPAIGDIASHVGSGATPRGGSAIYRKAGITFVRSQNVTFDGLLLDDVVFVSPAIHAAMSRSEIFPFDVLLNITGASIGRCCFVPAEFSPANVNQHVCAIRLPNSRLEDGVLLSAILASHIGQSQIDRLNAGGNREGLNYTQVRSFFVSWPEPDERKAIAERWQRARSRLESEESQLSKLHSLKRGLAHDLLTGRVRVNFGGRA